MGNARHAVFLVISHPHYFVKSLFQILPYVKWSIAEFAYPGLVFMHIWDLIQTPKVLTCPIDSVLSALGISHIIKSVFLFPNSRYS